MSARTRLWAQMFAVAALVLAVDQIAKAIVEGQLQPGEKIDLVLGFHLSRVTNEGIAFGLFSDGSDVLVLLFTGAALALVIGWFAYDTVRPWLWLGVGLLVGGAVGNLIDRVVDGGVTDFLDPPWWPAFNLADVAITAGVIVIALIALAPTPEPASEP